MTCNNLLFPCSQEHEILNEYRQGTKKPGYPLSSIVPLVQAEYLSSGQWLLQINSVGIDALACLDRGIIYDSDAHVGMVEQTIAYWQNIFRSTAVSADAIEICGNMPVFFFDVQKLAVDYILHSDKTQNWFVKTC